LRDCGRQSEEDDVSARAKELGCAHPAIIEWISEFGIRNSELRRGKQPVDCIDPPASVSAPASTPEISDFGFRISDLPARGIDEVLEE
jgi:hypothetical protein